MEKNKKMFLNRVYYAFSLFGIFGTGALWIMVYLSIQSPVHYFLWCIGIAITFGLFMRANINAINKMENLNEYGGL